MLGSAPTAQRRMPTVEAAYLVVGATLSAFCRDEPGAALCNTPGGKTENWYSSYLIGEWPEKHERRRA